jgi:hypothetical protein
MPGRSIRAMCQPNILNEYNFLSDFVIDTVT